MHIKENIIINSFNIADRGRVLVTDLDYDTKCNCFEKGDTLRYDDKIYEIIGVEAILHNDGKDFVAFFVKEITIKDLINKSVSQKKSNWVEKAAWRQKNDWWLKHWQWIQVKWYCVIKPFFKK